jgi:signal transduction histidine kinase
MSLATRVSLFFLASLAVTLAGFSAALYLLAARHLSERLNQRVEAALAQLTAAIEIKEDCVEWEPHERRLNLPGARWLVVDPNGRTVGSSPEPFPHLLHDMTSGPSRVAGQDGVPWLVLQEQVTPSGPPQPAPSGVGRPGGEGTYPWLMLAVAATAGADDASLRLLGWTLVGLSLAAWTLSALLGRTLCRRTVAPVARMASSARSIPASDPGQRLAVSPTGDELEELGRSFNGLLDRLQEAFERHRRFTGEASHQLRAPLAVMLGQVEVALRRDRPQEEYRRVLGIVAEQSARLQRVVEMLLFLARADAEAVSPAVSPLALRPWLREHLAGWATHPRAADLHLADGAELQALAQAPLLGQVVDVLIDNALKYGPPGSPVVLSLRVDGMYALLTVQDEGCGIEADDLPRIFEPFFRSPRQKGCNAGGVGLGLSIAQRIVEASGGWIVAQSERGCGSRFLVRLPLA